MPDKIGKKAKGSIPGYIVSCVMVNVSVTISEYKWLGLPDPFEKVDNGNYNCATGIGRLGR